MPETLLDPGQFNFTIYRNKVRNLSYTYKDDAGHPVNLTGYGATFAMRRSLSQATDDLSKSAGSGITLGGVNGTVEIDFQTSDFASLPDGNYFYSHNFVVSGVPEPVLTGMVTLSSEVF